MLLQVTRRSNTHARARAHTHEHKYVSFSSVLLFLSHNRCSLSESRDVVAVKKEEKQRTIPARNRSNFLQPLGGVAFLFFKSECRHTFVSLDGKRSERREREREREKRVASAGETKTSLLLCLALFQFLFSLSFLVPRAIPWRRFSLFSFPCPKKMKNGNPHLFLLHFSFKSSYARSAAIHLHFSSRH